MAKALQGRHQDASIEYFLNLQVWGTPEMCFNKIDEIRKKVNANHFTGVFSYAGMPWEDAEKSLRLFAKRSDAGTEEAERREGRSSVVVREVNLGGSPGNQAASLISGTLERIPSLRFPSHSRERLPTIRFPFPLWEGVRG